MVGTEKWVSVVHVGWAKWILVLDKCILAFLALKNRHFGGLVSEL
jgi:hypothetical protein